MILCCLKYCCWRSKTRKTRFKYSSELKTYKTEKKWNSFKYGNHSAQEVIQLNLLQVPPAVPLKDQFGILDLPYRTIRQRAKNRKLRCSKSDSAQKSKYRKCRRSFRPDGCEMNTGWKEDCIAQRTMTRIAEFCQ